MTQYALARAHMVDNQLRPNGVIEERLNAAFAAVRRELFVPHSLQTVAYVDDDLPLGGGRYLMRPFVAGRLLQAAAPLATDSALVVGAGTGYEAALLGRLTRSVAALEEDETLASRARFALAEERAVAVAVVEGALAQGYRAQAPYEVIVFAGAITEVAPEVESQLAEGGRLVAVLRAEEGIGQGVLVTRTSTGFVRRTLFDAAIPFLPGFAPEPAFTF